MQNYALATLFFLSCCTFAPCDDQNSSLNRLPKVSKWGKLPDGREVNLFRISNSSGVIATLSNYGALLVSVEIPDEEGNLTDVTLSYQNLTEALAGGVNGSVIGRFANRIDGGGFSIDGKKFELETVNKKTNVHIHGGKTGFHRQLWDVDINDVNAQNESVRFSLKSPDGHEGYPGEVDVSVRYTLTENNILRLDYMGETNAPTHLNLTNHVYFNLAGSGNVLEHSLKLEAEKYLEIDKRKIPTGNFVPVNGTPLDFTTTKQIGQDIEKIPDGGYDHCFVVPGYRPEGGLSAFATLSDPESGRTLEIATTLPGVQIYTANHFKGEPYPQWGGICFETQFYPDTPNKPQFPTSLLRPGETFQHATEFRFSWE